MLTTVGSLGLGAPLDAQIGFDIGPDGIAYASVVNGGASPDGMPVPTPIACGQIPAWIVSHFPACSSR